ncbi:hypothetical protein GCM10020219_000430 [Nonomuraea dietziae]
MSGCTGLSAGQSVATRRTLRSRYGALDHSTRRMQRALAGAHADGLAAFLTLGTGLPTALNKCGVFPGLGYGGMAHNTS